MKIIVADAATLGADLDLSPLSRLGEVEVYATTAKEEVAARFAGAEVAVVNKIRIDRAALGERPTLKMVAECATGYDNIDLGYCREKGIAVANVKSYSTDSVAQLTLAMALSLSTHLPEFTAYVANGSYTRGGVANRLTPVFHELRGKTWGVAGYGNIGKQVAAAASALGCRILSFARTPKAGVESVDLDELCRRSDILSIHLPLTPETRGLFGAREIALMKPEAILINVARGAVTDEAALAAAVREGRLGGLGVDVYSAEPFPETHPFYAIRKLPNVCFTPHMAWGAQEARARCLSEVCENIRAFAEGTRRNRVD